MLTRGELKARRSALSLRWEAMFSAGLVRQESPPGREGPAEEDRVLASWRRSFSHVDPEVDAAPVDDPADEVAQWSQSPVAAGVRGAEPDIRAVVDDGDLVAAVTDARGRIVWTYGGRVMQRAAERVNFVPGGRWDEDSVGTNALALALRTGAPSTVYSAEHFSRAVHGWVCYSVPLTDPADGSVLGVLDLSTTWDRAHPLVMGAAGALSRLVTSRLPLPVPRGSALQLTVLGGWSVQVDGRPLLLPHRQVEILVLLARHPSGLSLESLHSRLYGDDGPSAATLKAEVSHLRRALDGGIGSRPYRLLPEVRSDLDTALAALDAGDLAGAVSAAAGELLPGSESPEIAEWRRYLEVALRDAVLGAREVAATLALADANPYDEQLQEHLVAVLPVGDPRAASARARLERARA